MLPALSIIEVLGLAHFALFLTPIGPEEVRLIGWTGHIVSASNVFNNVNPLGYSGVMTSPFFGQATGAGPARKLDVGMKVGF